MRFYHGATALALVTTTALAQECPPGYSRSKKLDWKFCGQGIPGSTLECATIEVPKDWNNAATSDKLALQLIRQPSRNKNAKSIITNPGGPGESGIEMIIKSNIGLQQTFGDFHIVSFDPRGVGLTMPYKDCMAADSDKWKNPITSDDDQATADYKAAKAWGEACAAENKETGTLIGTAHVARDIMAIVEALEAGGEDGLIRYAGYSYGTLLGATLTAMFPKKVARVLLDGNINPTDYYRGDGIEAGTDVMKGVENFFAQCADAGKEKCALADNGQSAQTLLAQYNELLDKLSKTDASKNSIVRNEFFQVLYFKKPTAFKDFAFDLKAWITNPDSVKEREEREKRADFQASTWKKLQQKSAIMGITCGDRIIKDGTPAKYTQLKEAYRQKLGYYYDLTMSGSFECTVWEQNAAERFMGSFSDIETSHPVLIVNTPWDPVTPAISAEASRKAFRDSKLVMSNGVGHCTNAHNNPDLNKVIKEYFVNGKLPDLAEYKIADNNVFRKIPEPPVIEVDEAGVPIFKRDFRLPEYFQKRADGVPAGCTQIPVSSSALVSASASVVLSASASGSISMSASASASQSAEPTPAASSLASASASESLVLSHFESASASILAVPTASVSQSQEPTPSASVSASVSPSASDSIVASRPESTSASVAVTPSASASHSESASVLATVSASVSTSYEASLSASASESPILSHSASASASVSVQQSSESLSASVTPIASASESYVASPTPSASAHSESASVSTSHAISSGIYSGAIPSASASVAGEQGFQSSSVAVSASVSAGRYSSSAIGLASVSASRPTDYAMTTSSVAQSSSYPAESLTSSASASPVHNQGSASITASASYSAASSVEHFSSSGLYLSSEVQVSHSALSYPPSVSSTSAHVDVSSSVYSDASSSAVSSSASLSYSVPLSSSSAIYSDSSIVHPSATSSAVYPDASVYPSGSSSVVHSQSSQYPSGSSSTIDHTRSSVTGPSSAGSYYPASTPVYSSGSSTASTSSKTKPIHNHYPTPKSSASTTPAKSIDSKYPYSGSVPGYSSSVAPYPYGGDYAAGGDYVNGNAYSTGYYAVTTSSKPNGPKTTSPPCTTVPWSSQPGYVPITKTYTTTSVRTVTKCPDTIKDCPLNSSTKTYITTEIKTRTTVVATPSSSPTGNKSYPPNKESDKKSSAPPSKETKPVQSAHSVYAPPKISSNPSVPTSVPPYPTGPSTPSSVKVCNDMKCSYVAVPTGTKPITGTSASTTLKISTPSASTPSVSVCVGKNCKANVTPTGYKPAQFTGAASREFVSSMVGAGAVIVALVRFF